MSIVNAVTTRKSTANPWRHLKVSFSLNQPARYTIGEITPAGLAPGNKWRKVAMIDDARTQGKPSVANEYLG